MIEGDDLKAFENLIFEALGSWWGWSTRGGLAKRIASKLADDMNPSREHLLRDLQAKNDDLTAKLCAPPKPLGDAPTREDGVLDSALSDFARSGPALSSPRSSPAKSKPKKTRVRK